MKRLQGKVTTAKNEHLSFEINKAKSAFFPVFCKILEDELGAIILNEPTAFVSEIAGDIEINGVNLGYGWDNWRGVYLLSICDKGDKLIDELAQRINKRIKKVNYSEYISM